jgi:hypothetical protein
MEKEKEIIEEGDFTESTLNLSDRMELRRAL